MTKQKAGENMPTLTFSKLTAVLLCFLEEVDKQRVEINKSLEKLETLKKLLCKNILDERK